MLMQMRQMNLLSRQFQQKQPADAISAALAGSSGDSGGSYSGGGVKGCLAREAYLRLIEDPLRVASVVENHALQEMGLQPGQSYPGLMRDYIERRVPLGSYRLLTQVAYLAAAGWESGFRSSSKELQAFASKLLLFTEQTAMDSGRTSLSWLLTGLPEPNFSMCQQNVHRAGLRPFAPLAAPNWVVANVSYLRDLDFLEGKIRSQDKQDKTGAPKGEEDKKPKAFPKKRPKGKTGQDTATTGGGAPSA